MERKGFLLGAMAFIVVMWITGIASPADIPLPGEIEITTPSSDVPPHIAAFSGRWEGTWEGDLDSILIVEKIGLEKAKIIYAWGRLSKMESR